MSIGSYTGRIVSQNGEHTISGIEAFGSSRDVETVKVVDEIPVYSSDSAPWTPLEETLVESVAKVAAHLQVVSHVFQFVLNSKTCLVEGIKEDAFLSPVEDSGCLCSYLLNNPQASELVRGNTVS